MDLARAPRRAPLTARKKGSGYENDTCQDVFGQPRSQALPSCVGKTLSGAGHVTREIWSPQGGVGKRQSIKIHASTSTIYTSIARSESALDNQLWEEYKIQILAKFGSCLLLNYKKHAIHIFVNTQVRKSSNKNVWSYALKLFSCSLEASGALSFQTFLFCLWFTSHIYIFLIICR
jgi:hypothetical protein